VAVVDVVVTVGFFLFFFAFTMADPRFVSESSHCSGAKAMFTKSVTQMLSNLAVAQSPQQHCQKDITQLSTDKL
jgi:hypothetical protein